MKIKSLIIAFVLLPGFQAHAQNSGLFQVTYNMAAPMGDTKDFTDGYSWRGFNIGGRWFVNKNLSWGLNFGWNIFDQKITGTTEIENGAATGTQIRYLNSWPMMLNTHYYFGSKYSFRPYVGLNAGTYYIYERLDFGIYTIDRDNWHFGLAPELGFTYPVSESLLLVNLQYNYAFASGTSIGGSAKAFSYIGINVGFAFQY